MFAFGAVMLAVHATDVPAESMALAKGAVALLSGCGLIVFAAARARKLPPQPVDPLAAGFFRFLLVLFLVFYAGKKFGFTLPELLMPILALAGVLVYLVLLARRSRT